MIFNVALLSFALLISCSTASNVSQNSTVHIIAQGNASRSVGLLRGRRQASLRSESEELIDSVRPGGRNDYRRRVRVKPVLTPKAFIYPGAGIIMAITAMFLLTICEISGQTGKAYRTEEEVETTGEGHERVWCESIDELVDRLGIGGLCLVDLDRVTLSGFTRWATLPLLCIQCWFVQGGLIYYLMSELRTWPEGSQKDLPSPLLILALYLHTVICLNDIALAFTIFGQLRNIATNASQFYFVAPMIFMDTFVIPASSLVVGTLYLVTSRTVSDVILNSCALAFIGNIDNWILGAMHAMNDLAGTNPSYTLVLPINPEFLYYVNNGLVVFPLMPLLFACYMLYVGEELLHL